MFYDGEFFFGQDRIFFIEEMIQNERDSENRA
jgi:2-hydroxychromene-2-carboxylate isomerase